MHALQYLPEGRTLTEFDRRFLAEADVEFSSFTYRIAAARALSEIIVTSIGQSPAQTVSSTNEAELILENLILHLPKKMETIFNDDESVNDMLFQTHMILNA